VFTLLALMVAENITYVSNTLRFCAICDAAVVAALCIGIVWDRMELTAMANAEQTDEPAQPEQTDEPVEVPRILAKHEKKPTAEIDEVEPIPEMLEVGNDFVRRAEK
jgi:hypothetical protein